MQMRLLMMAVICKTGHSVHIEIRFEEGVFRHYLEMEESNVGRVIYDVGQVTWDSPMARSLFRTTTTRLRSAETVVGSATLSIGFSRPTVIE